ncbi:aldehyde dehydrogenase [Baekduia soli]|uniref:Aldehyde dehydrogenase n=1 Tax=Baekduia soli TaxID=496014 RepID=A0A5B8U0A6_9ACTN|nr:aldehyde dehydrogenase [Baekduia soli]QEC46416.1 aldehyde dehydrogenase [Baekduia soli]
MTATQTSPVRSFDSLFIGGRWVSPSSDAVIEVINPITEEVIATVPDAQDADMDAAVAAAREAFDHGPWPRMTPAERAEAIGRIADELHARADELALVFAEEVGASKAFATLIQAGAETKLRDATTFHERFELETEVPIAGNRGRITHEPVGVVAAVIPWNGPVTTLAGKLAPSLAAGCTVVVKPAPDAPVGTMIFAEAIEAAGLPEGVVSILPGGREVGEHLVSNPDVDKVTFTGSTAAGKRIMSICSERIARVTLELGGKSAAIIADDIPFDQMLSGMVAAGIGHSGQVCAALTRVLVPRHRQQELLDALVPVIESMTVGDPREEGVVIGPLVAERQRERVEGYIEIGRQEGARVVIGGGRPAGLDRGYFVEPTVFADVTNDMRIAQEEIFGPVLCVIPFDDVEEAIAIANDSSYGLSGAVYAQDTELAERIARRIRTGQISINTWSLCPGTPFGGFKQSGLGREGGVEGYAGYLETKVIQYG